MSYDIHLERGGLYNCSSEEGTVVENTADYKHLTAHSHNLPDSCPSTGSCLLTPAVRLRVNRNSLRLVEGAAVEGLLMLVDMQQHLHSKSMESCHWQF